ncbi:MAG: NAD-dependent epimerase/dehydratase family protein [Planctomycetia bacterium]|nr:NAD-dependent epimerase/dehydratase family protein [Planctomycetia bacterium]
MAIFNRLDPTKRYLITGAAGFIGSHLAAKLAKQGATVVGYDNINDYYDVNLKLARIKNLEVYPNFKFIRGDLAEQHSVDSLFKNERPDYVINLAAQAGVRYSIVNPRAYITSNLVGFFNILEACRHNEIAHLLYASSSSVYGDRSETPFSTRDRVDEPLSLYAATKRSNEILAFSYSHLYKLPTTGLRFFTVYGPWGRPDMAAFIFARKIFANEPIELYNNGDMYRDFTYIDDIVQGVENMICNPPKPDAHGNPVKIYNIGNNKPEKLADFVAIIERLIGRQAQKKYLPMQPGDVYQTYADVDDLVHDFDFRPNTPIEVGLARFIQWYREYYQPESVD